MFVVGERQFCSLRLQISGESVLSHNYHYLLVGVGIVGLHHAVGVAWSHAESGVRRQCPWCCCPCGEICLSPFAPLRLRFRELEEGCGCGVLHVAVATRLVQLVRRESCSRSWGVWLNGVALVEQALVVELSEQPPKSLYVLVVVGDVRVVEVNEIAHLLCQLSPLCCEFHHVFTAAVVVVLHRDVFVRLMVVDVCLGYSKFLLHTELHGQSVCVPSCLSLHLIALHRLVSVEGVLNGACEHMVYSRVSVCRGRSLEEHKLRTTFTFFYRLVEHIVTVPCLKYVLVYLSQV